MIRNSVRSLLGSGANTYPTTRSRPDATFIKITSLYPYFSPTFPSRSDVRPYGTMISCASAT